jgi:hypothetical protein
MLTALSSAADGAHAALDAADPGDTCQSPDYAKGVLQTGRIGFCDLAHFFGLREPLRVLPTRLRAHLDGDSGRFIFRTSAVYR